MKKRCQERGKQGGSSLSFHSLPRASSVPTSQDKSFYQPNNPQNPPLSCPSCLWGLTAQSHCSKGDPSSGADPWIRIHPKTCWPCQDGYSPKQHIRVPGAHPKGYSPWQLQLGLARDPLEIMEGNKARRGKEKEKEPTTPQGRAERAKKARAGNTEQRQKQQRDQAPNTSQLSHEQPHFIQQRPNSHPDPENIGDPQARGTAMSLLLLQGW